MEFLPQSLKPLERNVNFPAQCEPDTVEESDFFLTPLGQLFGDGDSVCFKGVILKKQEDGDTFSVGVSDDDTMILSGCSNKQTGFECFLGKEGNCSENIFDNIVNGRWQCLL